MQRKLSSFHNERFWPRSQFGIKQFITIQLGSGEVQIPADVGIYLAYIVEGQGVYNDISVQQGDLLAFGLNKSPIVGTSDHMKLFIIELNFSLFFQITNLVPLICQKVVKLNELKPLNCLCNLFSCLPYEEWTMAAESFLKIILLKSENKTDKKTDKKTERILYATKQIKYASYDNLNAIAEQIGISIRQMERDFKSFLGLTPKEYERIVRFYKAIEHLQCRNMAEVAIHSGYWDQSHMTREFRRLSVGTPNEFLQKGGRMLYFPKGE